MKIAFSMERSAFSEYPSRQIKWIKKSLGYFFITLCLCCSEAVFSETDCTKSLQYSELLQSDKQEVKSVIERYRLIFETSDRDIYPAVRLRIKLAKPFSEVDRECLDRHIPIIYIDGFQFPQLPLRYLPSEELENKPDKGEPAAGGTPLAIVVGSKEKPEAKPIKFDTIEFEMLPNDKSNDIWLRLHNAPRPFHDVDVGIGFKVAAENIPAGVELRRFDVERSMHAGMAPIAGYNTAWIALVLSIVIGLIAALALWKKETGVLQTSGAPLQGTVQAFAWFVFIMGMAIHLWVLTGTLPEISPTLIGLMGASGSTLVVSRLMNNKEKNARTSHKPLTDVPSIQMWGFNVMVMLSFVIDSHQYLKLAAIEPTWAGVIGVSNSVYLLSAKQDELL